MARIIRPRAAVLRMGREAGLREGRGGKLRLDFNENTVGCSGAARAAVARITRQQIATYPEYGPARARLAKFFKARPDEVVLTNGADEALRLVFDAFIERRDPVLLVQPTFPMYRIYAALYDARVIELRYDAAMRFPLADVLRALRRGPRAFFLANPNNPTGTLLGRRKLLAILQAARRTLVVVDEAYFEFCGITALPWIRRYGNLVIVRTFSKGAGLAGLRLGCLLARRELAGALRTAQPPFPVNRAALAAAEAEIANRATARRYVAEVRRAKRLLEAGLGMLGMKFHASGGNFLLVDFGPRASEVVAALERKGILVRDRRADLEQSGYVRITIGTRPQMRRVLHALDAIRRRGQIGAGARGGSDR